MSKRDNEHFITWQKRLNAMFRNHQRKQYDQAKANNSNNNDKKSSTAQEAPAAPETT